MTARYLIGDTRAVTATIPDASVDLIMTSPPFLALRSYLPEGHPAKHLEIGSEPDPATFLDVLLALTAEWGRVLAPHGSICVELGDTYAGSGGSGGDYAEGGIRAGQGKASGSSSRSGWHRLGARAQQVDTPPNYRKSGTVASSDSPNGGPGWPLAKSLCGIPHLYHLSLAYGRNLLTGEPSPAGQWRVRNVVAWCRPNPPVGALGDKYRPATSYLTIATRSAKRYFDLDAVRGAPSENTHARTAKGVGRLERTGKSADRDGNWSTLAEQHETQGAPPLDYWVIPPAPYKGSHYAAYPPALCEKPIESMVPRRVCTTCGEPSRRITEKTEEYSVRRAAIVARDDPGRDMAKGLGYDKRGGERVSAENVTTGWTDCGHNTWRNGLVLDPFAGSGTTLMVASGRGRDSIGIDIDERNAELARERVGPLLLEVVDTREKAAS